MKIFPKNDLSKLKKLHKMDYVLDYIDNYKKRSDCTSNHIALLLKGNTIVCDGYNKFTLSCKSPLADPITIHAEMDCISSYLKYNFEEKEIQYFRRQKFSMFVTKKSAEGFLGSSTPCTNCVKKMYHFGIHRIYWTTRDGTIKFEKVSKMLDTYPENISKGNNPIKLKDCHFHRKKTN